MGADTRKAQLCAIILWLTTLPLSASNLAVVVGVGQYPETSGLNVLAADNDAEQLSAALTHLGWKVVLLNANQQDQRYRSTRANILRVLGISVNPDNTRATASLTAERFTGNRDLTADDNVLFYFGGHGVSDFNEQDILLPLDARYGEGKIAAESEIRLSWVRDALRATKAGKVVLILDACREGVGGRAATRFHASVRSAVADQPPIASVDFPQNQRTLIFKSTSDGKWAHEMQQQGMGVFSYFLVRALTDSSVQREANRLRDGQVTLRDIFDWVSAQTSEYVANLPATSRRGPQEPGFQGDSLLNFVVAQVPVQPPSPPPPAPTPVAQTRQPEIHRFTASTTTVTKGNGITLHWRIENAISAEITSDSGDEDIGSVDPKSGSARVFPTENQTYTLTAVGEDGSRVDDTVRVRVREEEQPNSAAGLGSHCANPQTGIIFCSGAPLPLGSSCTCPGVYGIGIVVP